MPETLVTNLSDKAATEKSNKWVEDSIRDALTVYLVTPDVAETLSDQLQGLASERSLKNSELSTLAQTLIAALKETPPAEPML